MWLSKVWLSFNFSTDAKRNTILSHCTPTLSMNPRQTARNMVICARCEFVESKMNQLLCITLLHQVCRNINGQCTQERCCAYHPDDITELINIENTYRAYANCSGKVSCNDVRAPWQLMNIGVPSSYVNLQYECDDSEYFWNNECFFKFNIRHTQYMLSCLLSFQNKNLSLNTPSL